MLAELTRFQPVKKRLLFFTCASKQRMGRPRAPNSQTSWKDPLYPLYIRFKGGLSPRDRRMDHSRNIPAKARTAPAIAYINMFTDKPIATSEAPKKIIQTAPTTHTIRHHQCSSYSHRTFASTTTLPQPGSLGRSLVLPKSIVRYALV
jgi:hypothetical protein